MLLDGATTLRPSNGHFRAVIDDKEAIRRGPIFGILLLNWNTHEDVVECILSIQAGTYQRFRIYVIDNGSMPESVDHIKSRLSAITIIENRKNLGFTGGFNVGIRRALEDEVDIVCLLNSDMFVSPDFLQRLSDAFADPDIAAASPKELDYYFRDRIRFAGGQLGPVFTRHKGHGRLDGEEFSVACDSGLLCGPAMVFRARTLEILGGLDERLFFNHEDRDMALRLRKAGLRIQFVPEARVWHKGAGSIGGRETPLSAFFGVRNYLLVARKHGNGAQLLGAMAMVVLYWIPTILYRAVESWNSRYFTGLKWALIWFLDSSKVPSDPEAVDLLLDSNQDARVGRQHV